MTDRTIVFGFRGDMALPAHALCALVYRSIPTEDLHAATGVTVIGKPLKAENFGSVLNPRTGEARDVTLSAPRTYCEDAFALRGDPKPIPATVKTRGEAEPGRELELHPAGDRGLLVADLGTGFRDDLVQPDPLGACYGRVRRTPGSDLSMPLVLAIARTEAGRHIRPGGFRVSRVFAFQPDRMPEDYVALVPGTEPGTVRLVDDA